MEPMHSRIFAKRAAVLMTALFGLASLPANAAMSAGSIDAGATLTSVSTLTDSLNPTAEASSVLLADAGSASSSGEAYLLFAQALTQQGINRQTRVGTEIVSYVTSFGPINRTVEDGGSPTPVPIPATGWLLLSGLALLRKGGTKRAAEAVILS